MFRMEISEYDRIIQFFKGMGNKTGTSDYLGHPVPLLEGEIIKQESHVSKGDLFSGLGHNASLALSLSIQFMYLLQPSVEHFISN